MSDQHTVAQIQIDRDDLERSQDAIHEAQHDLDALLEQSETLYVSSATAFCVLVNQPGF